MSYTLGNLDALEAETIHIIREVVAEFENPVLLYSIGKDSMCMLHVARKAFAPARVPFPFAHDTIAGLAPLHAEQPIPDPRLFRTDIPAEVAAIITQCLAKNPQDRFQDSVALLREMQRVFSGMRDFTTLVAKALAELSVDITSSDSHIVAAMRLAEDRSQRVHIEVCPAQLGESRLIRIYSICAPIDEAYFRRALEFNATMPHGSLAIQDIDGEPHFVVLNSYLQSTCEQEDIRRSVQEVARWADYVEHMLTGRDDR